MLYFHYVQNISKPQGCSQTSKLRYFRRPPEATLLRSKLPKATLLRPKLPKATRGYTSTLLRSKLPKATRGHEFPKVTLLRLKLPKATLLLRLKLPKATRGHTSVRNFNSIDRSTVAAHRDSVQTSPKAISRLFSIVDVEWENAAFLVAVFSTSALY